MKIICLADNTIPDDELQEVVKKFNDLYAPLSPDWNIHREDMSDLVWEPYLNSQTIDRKYLKRRIQALKERYDFDHLLIWVAHDNYPPAEGNVWGMNFSYFYGIQLHQCRFDTDRKYRESRIINTFGTLVHEVAHSHDAVIYNKLGIKLGKVLSVGDYDERFVHGNSIRFEYIGRDEDINADTIKEEIMPLLVKAYKARLINKAVSLIRQIIIKLTKKDYE